MVEACLVNFHEDDFYDALYHYQRNYLDNKILSANISLKKRL